MQALCMRLKSNLLGPTTLAGVIVAVCLLCGPAGGAVQNGDVAARLPAAEAQAHHLSQQIDNISKDSVEIRVAQLFGESDEEKAARSGSIAFVPDLRVEKFDAVTRMQLRISRPLNHILGTC